MLGEWLASAQEVQAAVQGTESGIDAVDTMMRTVFNRYRQQLDLFVLVHVSQAGSDFEHLFGPDELARIRPVNEMFYGGAEARLLADQKRGAFPEDRNPRRFVFTAHMAVIGMLNMKAMTESSADPLIHTDDDLIDDICRTFRDAATRTS